MEILIYLAVIAVVVGIIIGGVWLSKKFNIQKEDFEFVLLLLGLVNYVTAQVQFKYQEPIVEVMELVIDAVEIVRDTYDETDMLVLKQYILDEAEKLCIENGMTVDDEFEHLLSVAVDYLII